MKSLFSLAVVFLFAANVHAQSPRRRVAKTVEQGPSKVTYDLSAATGSYNGASYSEINLGLNWSFQEWMTWRNAVFFRQGANVDSVQGLDSSLRFSTSVVSEDSGLGFDAFAGPGLRFATKDNNAIFGEAGLVFRLGGLRIGFGAKVLNYTTDRKDSLGAALSKTDTQYFLILGGGGVL